MFPEGNVPGYVCNPGSPRERDAASQGHTSGIPTRALLHSWKLAPAAHHGLLSILVVTSPTPDVWLSILTDYTYDSELDIADGVPLAFRRSVSFPRGTRVTYVTWDDKFHCFKHLYLALVCRMLWLLSVSWTRTEMVWWIAMTSELCLTAWCL